MINTRRILHDIEIIFEIYCNRVCLKYKTEQRLLAKIFQIWLFQVTLFTFNLLCSAATRKVQNYIEFIALLEILHLIVILLNFSGKERMSISRKGTDSRTVSM